jgi:hypothetical protein
LKALVDVSGLIIISYVGVRGVRVKCGIHGRKNLGAVGGAILETCSLQNILVCRRKNTRDRTPDSVGGEAGKAATPAFAADDRAFTTTVLGRFLEREQKPPAYSCMWEG